MNIDRPILDTVLEDLGGSLDISPSDYNDALASYNAVGEWLKAGFPFSYPGSRLKPTIYLQGSMALGTVVRPLRGDVDADFDVDLVCELSAEKGRMLPAVVKKQPWTRLQSHDIYRAKMGKEGRRCWTLDYPRKGKLGFHMDILPCVPEDDQGRRSLNELAVSDQYTKTATAITHWDKDKTQTYRWLPSNPLGFAKWFANRNMAAFSVISAQQKRAIFERYPSLFASEQVIPDPLVHTALQRTIQILKRHRDYRFRSDPDNKPISMIITTLAAHLYANEASVSSALDHIVSSLIAYSDLVKDPQARLDEKSLRLNLIQRASDGGWYIGNPVNPGENFADKWHEKGHAKAKAFFDWLRWLSTDILTGTRAGSPAMIKEAVGKVLGLSLSSTVVPATSQSNSKKTYPESNGSVRPWGI